MLRNSTAKSTGSRHDRFKVKFIGNYLDSETPRGGATVSAIDASPVLGTETFTRGYLFYYGLKLVSNSDNIFYYWL